MGDNNERTRVQVAVRIRPVAEQESGDKNKIAVYALDETSVITHDESRGERQFKFDNVLVGDQASVFAVLGQPMLEEAYKGFNVCLFAYGQTGSGKTYSVLGDTDSEERLGLAPRFVRSLFAEAQRRVEDDPDLTIKVTLSMVEVYMEKVRDLLAPRVRGQEPESLEVREDASRRVYVKGAGVHPVLSYERMIELLKKGNSNRQTAETRMNETSSRSHAIMQITITQEYKSIEKKDLECTATLVDLAGSERQTKAESTGHHFEEAKKINHSLLMLGRALNSFSERRNGDGFISLRESKLTRLLSESFGGNSKTWMLGTVSPTAYNLTETISTLEYASNAMAITNRVMVNNAFKNLQTKELRVVVTHLERQLEQLSTIREEKELDVSECMEARDALVDAVQMARQQETTRTRLASTLRALQLGNIALRRRVEAAAHRLVWSLDNEGSFLFFKGRCGLSLETALLGKPCSFVLGLQTDNGLPTAATLNVHLFSVDAEAGRERDDAMSLVGTDLHFCLHVVGAEGIPEAFSAHTFCKFSIRYDQEHRYFTTPTCENTCSPHWGLVKKFEIFKLTPEIITCFTSQHLFTFEVFGFST